MAKGLLYRTSRHPQYLALGVAGLGLLTIWPRFLLLGIWVTMLFLYAGLARFEEWRMEDRYGEEYRQYAAYVLCLAFAFSFAHLLREYTQAHTPILARPEQNATVISAWPQPHQWTARIFKAAVSDRQVRRHLQGRGKHPVVATILPARYRMTGMYYKMPKEQPPPQRDAAARRIARIVVRFLVPWSRPKYFMGVDPDTTKDAVQVVFSRAEKPYKEDLPLEEALDASVRLPPLVVAHVEPEDGKLARVEVQLPQNNWGPKVVMPLM